MYVLKAGDANGVFYPADRCTYKTVNDTTGGYQITVVADQQATFYDGTSASGTLIPGADTAATRPILGYIGKSGRFVAMSNE